MGENDPCEDVVEESSDENSVSPSFRDLRSTQRFLLKKPRKIALDAAMFKATQKLVPRTPSLTQGIEDEFKGEEGETENPEVITKTPFNERALSRFTPTYELEKFKKNALIIFNQEDTGDDLRYGTHWDVEALTRTFEKYGFEVKENTHNDLTKDEIFEKLREFTSRDFTEYGCIAVAVLTHGSNFGSLRAKDRKYSEMEIVNHLKAHNKPTLVTKPKLLIIQACRGTRIKQGVPVWHSSVIKTDAADADIEPYHLPEEADMLILHSCYVDNASMRHELNGSWFIQSLCNKIDQLAHKHDLESIITEVKREVAIDRYLVERDTLPMHITQMPVLTSTLIRKLYLKKYGDPITETDLPTPLAETALVSPLSVGHQTLDEAKSPLPLLSQFGPCSCFLDHFSYMRECLKHFVQENPEDELARLHLCVANSFEDTVDFNTPKESMLKVIHEHFRRNANKLQYYKFLYFCDK